MSDSTERPRRPLLASGERLRHGASSAPRGGPKFHPVSALDAYAALGPQGRALATEIDALPREAVGRHLVFEATLRPNYLASSYFPESVLEGLYVVGARTARATKITQKKVEEDQPTRRLILAGTDVEVRRFANRLATAPALASETDWDELRRFSEVSLPRKESVIVSRPRSETTTRVTFEAVVTHVGGSTWETAQWADEHFERFVAWVGRCGGVVDSEYRRDVAGLTFVPVLAPPRALDRIADFNLLRAIRPMPEIAPFPEDLMRTLGGLPTRSKLAEDGERPEAVVAIFDGGVADSLSVFAPFVTAHDLTTEPPETRAMRHGSMVTSAVLYGPLTAGGQLPDPTVSVDHFRVLPLPPLAPGAPDHRLYELLDKMLARLRAKRYPLVVLAIGPNDAVDDAAEPDRFTAELDALMKERDITVVSAAGNNGELDSALGYDRVQPPADCVNGIGVGASDSRARDPKKRSTRARYSARGPGREGQRVQPMVVEFGGSDAERFVGFDERGRLASLMGTSFAAPAVGRALGGLQSSLEPHRHIPDIFRAFVAHTAERGHGHGKKYLDLGFGRVPASFDPTFECPANEVTVLYEDSLPRSEVVAMRLPFPGGVPATVKLEVTWTIAYTSDVDPRDATDYTLSGIETVFRPDSRVRTLTDAATKVSRVVQMDTDRLVIRDALARGAKLSEPTAHSGWSLTKGEQRLRRSGKWETIVPGRVLLDAGELHEPRLDMHHLRRAQGQLVTGSGVTPLRFAMLVTIKAPPGVPLYDLVAAEYRVLTPVVRVPIRLSGVA